MTIMQVKNPPAGTHPSADWGDGPYPGVYEINSSPVSGGTNHRIKPDWWEYTRKVNELMGTLAGWRAAHRNNAGWINWAANQNWAQGEMLPETPDPLPIVEGVITIHNYVEVLEKFNQSARIKIFDYLEEPPDVSAVNPFTNPELFDLFRSVNKAGDVGYAPDGEKFYFPRLAKNGIGWLPLEILEPAELPITLEEPTMTLNPFPNVSKGVAIHRLSQCFNGDINKTLDFCQAMGFQSIHMKVGNGRVPWVGLEPFITATRARGINVFGWWYYWGYQDEGEISGKHIAYLASVGLQAVELDVEIEFDNSLGTSGTLSTRKRNLESKAHAIGVGLRKYNPHFPIALCSWRDPSYRATPTRVFLQYCDANMQQIYSIGTGGPTPAIAAQRINDSIAVYAQLQHGGWTGPTIPFVAAFHQAGNYVTVPQLAAVNQRVQDLNLPGLVWYFLPHIIEHTEWAAEIKSHNWPVSYVPAPPIPDPLPLTLEQRMDRAEDLMRAHGWL